MAGGKIDEVENHVIRSTALMQFRNDRFGLETNDEDLRRVNDGG